LEAVVNLESHGMIASAQSAKLHAVLILVALPCWLIVLFAHAACRIFFFHEEVGDFYFTDVHGANERSCASLMYQVCIICIS